MTDLLLCCLCDKDLTATPHQTIVIFVVCQECHDSPTGQYFKRKAYEIVSAKAEKTRDFAKR